MRVFIFCSCITIRYLERLSMFRFATLEKRVSIAPFRFQTRDIQASLLIHSVTEEKELPIRVLSLFLPYCFRFFTIWGSFADVWLV